MHREDGLTAQDGTQLAWQSWSPEAAPRALIVFVHGGAEHGGRYERLVSSLVARGFVVAAPDLRGHGRSGGRRGTIRRFTDYLDDLGSLHGRLGEIWPELPTFLAGYSLGALVTGRYALAHQDSLAGLVMAAPALGVGDDISPLQFRVAEALSRLVPRLPVLRMDPAAMMSDPAIAAAYREDPLVFRGRFDARMLGELIAVMRAFPDEVARLRLPLLVLHGAEDVTASPRASRGAFDRAGSVERTWRTYPGLRHDLFNEPEAEQVIGDIVAWLESRVSAGTQTTREEDEAWR